MTAKDLLIELEAQYGCLCERCRRPSYTYFYLPITEERIDLGRAYQIHLYQVSLTYYSQSLTLKTWDYFDYDFGDLYSEYRPMTQKDLMDERINPNFRKAIFFNLDLIQWSL